jgi:integrase
MDRPWSYDAAQKELKNIMEKLDIKKKTLHSFRESAATAAVEDCKCGWNAPSLKKSYVRATSMSTATLSSILKNIGA